MEGFREQEKLATLRPSSIKMLATTTESWKARLLQGEAGTMEMDAGGLKLQDLNPKWIHQQLYSPPIHIN